MAKLIRSLLRHTLFKSSPNLVSLDDPYGAIARLLRGRTVRGILDAGASHGRVASRLQQAFPNATVYAFEPNPYYREVLQQRAAADPRFVPQYVALSDHDGEAQLQVTRSLGSTSLFAPAARLTGLNPQGAEVTARETVSLVTLDAWAAAQGDPPLELLKFDIQGGEAAALRGAQRTLRTSTLLVYTEVLFNPLYEGGALFGELDALLRDAGLVLYNIYKPKSDERGLLLWGNAIYVHADKLGL